MGGANLYNFIWIVPDVRFDLQASIIPTVLMAVSVLYISIRYGRSMPFLEAVLAVMLASFLFGKVMNEQFLVSIFPLILLCKRCDYRIWVAPLAFIFLRSPFFYFAIPIMWASPYFYDLYLQLNTGWQALQTCGLPNGSHVCGRNRFLFTNPLESSSGSKGSRGYPERRVNVRAFFHAYFGCGACS